MSLDSFQSENTWFEGKKILLGVTGGIAAYKAALLARELIKLGAEVRVVMTASAKTFITPLTFQALTGNPVHDALLDTDAEAAMGHIELARWADLTLIAPATANTMAKLASGLADDLLTTLCLASKSPLFICPAMNQAMWQHQATQTNCDKLRQLNYHLIGPDHGIQACGDVGPGRMLEPVEIIKELEAQMALPQSHCEVLKGKHIVITAGPTREAIDPVRYISNHSSGKMGYALAQQAALMGATVTLVSGPTQLASPSNVQRIGVASANEMLEAVRNAVPKADIFISCAAVADYRMETICQQKIKKTTDKDFLDLHMVKNPDILATIAAENSQLFCVGFAAETQNLDLHAWGKLERKQLDMIVGNDVSQQGIGFNSDENAVRIFFKSKGIDAPVDIAQTTKTDLAQKLLTLIVQEQ
jgi:phosphopantothenoylcysteine decarboxylase / phosphopantothenate---cysteine ligase